MQPVRTVADPEYPYTRSDFDRVRSLIGARAGIRLNDSKENMVYSRLSRRIRALGLSSFTEYLDQVERDAGAEAQEFVNAMTTNLTAFYREPYHFPMLAEFLQHCRRPPVIWCAAASTGEEPYSIAMTATDAVGSGLRPRILATDIDTGVLATARRGVYTLESAAPIPHDQLRRHFLKGTGPNAGRVRVRPALSALIDFRQLNLLDADWKLGGTFDAIFCRNVLIYFDKPTQRSLLERMAQVLRPGGLLFIGHSENITDRRDVFRLRGKTAYERLAEVKVA